MEREYYIACKTCKQLYCSMMGVRYEAEVEKHLKEDHLNKGHDAIIVSGVGTLGLSKLARLIGWE